MAPADGSMPAGARGALDDRALVDDLILGFRFGVFFFSGGVVPNTLDLRFQRVSGLSAEVILAEPTDDGQSLTPRGLPDHVEWSNLVLERGMVVGSPLNLEFNAAMSALKFVPSNVLVTLFGADRTPVAAWLFHKAFPVKWTISDLDASERSVVVETLELSHTRMQSLVV